jgi:uncharacterized protein (DUF488 family)
MVIYTIGHSTRSLDEFRELLRAHHIGRVADIRTVPRSRRHPHFAADALRISLPAIGIEYRHFSGLGGLRKPRRDSRNSAWRHEGFRGYADYMETAEFREALTDLIAWAPESRADLSGPAEHYAAGPKRPGLRTDAECTADLSGPPERYAGPERPGLHTVMMCAEAVWWRCHRQLTADALLARGVEVAHIMGAGAATAHKLRDFARLVDGEVRYPRLT